RMRTSFLALVAAVAAASLVGCQRSGDPLVGTASAQTTAAPVPVQTTRATVRDVARVISLPGDILAMDEATLYAEVPGTLERIFVDRGDRVLAGQLLAVIRAPELEADHSQARQSYLSAQESAQVSQAADRKTEEEGRRARTTAEKVQADYAQAPASVQR